MLVNRVLAGFLLITTITPHVLACGVSRKDKYFADVLYKNVFEQCQLSGLWNEEDLLSFLIENEIWDVDKQKRFDEIPKEIEDLKVELYNCYFKSLDKEKIRKKIKTLRSEYEKLYSFRYNYFHLTCDGVALLAKSRYLIGCGLRDENGKKILIKDWWNKPNDVLEHCVAYITSHKISDDQLRELARTEPWRSHWNGRKAGRLFNKTLTDDQLSLVTWTSVYDNIYQSQDCPPQSVIDDDDCLDGWMIIQRRKRGENETKNQVDELVKNPKIRSSQEIFIVAQTPEDAAKVDSLNDTTGAIVKAQRFAKLNKHGRLHELELPDVEKELHMEFNKGMAERMKRI